LFSSLLLITFASTNPSSGSSLESAQLNSLYERFLDWWINVPTSIAPETKVTDCISHIEDDYIFLMDPWGKNIIANCEFSSGHSIFVPFAHGWCDDGNSIAYNATMEVLRKCLGEVVNGGDYKIENTYFDNKEVVNSIITIHGDTSITVEDNFPSTVLKIIDDKENLFNITVKNGTRYQQEYKNPEEFSLPPFQMTYQGIGQCLCGIIDSSLLTPGPHTLSYTVKYEGGTNLKSWDAKYNIAIKDTK
jgi:hypothetical protein